MRDTREFTEFEIAEVLNADPDTDAENGKHQAQGAARRPQQEQAQHREDRRNAVEQDHDLPVRHAVLQEFVVDVLAIGGEHGPSADEAANHREHGLKNRQAEGHDRNCNSDDRGRLLRAVESEGAEQESDEEAAGVSQENCGRIEVETKKSEDRPGQDDRHDLDEVGTVEQGDDEHDHRGEERRTGGKSVESVNQVEGVRDGQDPYHGEQQSDVPGQRAIAEDNGNVHDAQTAGIQQCRGNSLHGEFHIRADAAEVVIHSKQKNDSCRQQDGRHRLQELRRMDAGMHLKPDSRNPHAQRKAQEDRDAAETRQGT